MPANYLTGYAPTNMLAYASQAGTHSAPLDSFSVDGRTGNKTTNKDLPAWLRAIGMKGDAYAGGMLKPEIRYGFAYKHGKIYFADGTSFAATKNKGGTYSYTDGSGQQVSYNPTDEQNAYNNKYHASTSNQSFLDKATNAVKFELDHGKQILSHIKPSQVFFGIDPIGTKIGNALTGSHATAQVDQLGGALPGRYADYTARTGNATGYAKPLQGVAHVVAGVMGAQGAANGLGNLADSVGSGASAGSSIAPGTVAADTAQASATMPGIGGTSGALGGLGSLGGASSAGSGANMGWGDWVNLAGSLYGAYAQGQGASNAANAQVKGDAAALAEQRREFDLARGDQMPWLQSGTAALGRLNDPNAFQASPSYNFVKNEAMNGVQNSAAARGGLYSGNTLRALQDRGANVASQEYNNWFNQQSSLAGNGQASAQSLGSLGQQNSNNVSNLLSQQGNARASGIEGQTNALTGGISDFLSWYNRRRQGGG